MLRVNDALSVDLGNYRHVRCSPFATEIVRRATRRVVPIADMGVAIESRCSVPNSGLYLLGNLTNGAVVLRSCSTNN